MKFAVITIIEADSEEQAREVRNELAASLEDARESGELPSGSSFAVGDLDVIASPELTKQAQELYQDDDLQVDPDGIVRGCDAGSWLEAWAFVPNNLEN